MQRVAQLRHSSAATDTFFKWRPSEILDFQKIEILTPGRFMRVNVRHNAHFGGDQSKCCWLAAEILWRLTVFSATICKTLRPMLSNRCLSCMSVLSVTLVYCGQTVGLIKMPPTWHGCMAGLGPGHVVLDVDSAPKKGHSPAQFSAYVCCGKTAQWIKIPLGREVGLGPGDIVLDGDPASPPQKRGTTAVPTFRPMYCGQTAAWSGFCSAADRARLNAFLRRCQRLGYCSRETPAITELFDEAIMCYSRIYRNDHYHSII